MKHLFILFITLWGFAGCSDIFGQKIKENSIDEFTGRSKTTTDVIWFSTPNRFNSYCRFVRFDSVCYANFRLSMYGKVIAVENGAKLMLKLANDSIITLYNKEYAVAQKGHASFGFVGSGVEGVNLFFPIPPEYYSVLTTKTIIKIRLYTTDGYSDQEIGDGAEVAFRDTLKLLLETKPIAGKQKSTF